MLIPMNLIQKDKIMITVVDIILLYIFISFVFLSFYAYKRHQYTFFSLSNFLALLSFALTVSVEKNWCNLISFVYVKQRKYSIAACTPVW